MSDSELTLPPDLEFRMVILAQQDIMAKQDLIKKLLILHETELACLWLCVVGLSIALLMKHKEAHSE